MNNLELLLGLTPSKHTHPPIHWAGGKSKLLSKLYPHFSGNRLIDVFMGSTIVALNSPQESIIINDLNKDLVSLFTTIKDNKDDLIEKTLELFKETGKDNYIKYRNQFNESSDSFERAYLFLYLNRFGFNGLCRYSSKGNYNVSYGGDKKVNPPIKEIKETSKILNRKNTIMTNLSFLDAMNLAEQGDVVYADPPYIPLTQGSHTNYSGDGFTTIQHQELKDKAVELRNKNIKTIISNSYTPYTLELYSDANQIIEVELYRAISGDKKSRKITKEIIAIYE